MKTNFKWSIFLDSSIFRRVKKQIQTVVKNTTQKAKKGRSPISHQIPEQELENLVLKQDVLKRHAVALPQNADIDKLQPLITKLHTALIETHSTIAIGSNNKISCCEKICLTQRNSLANLRQIPSKLYFQHLNQSESKQAPLPHEVIKENQNNLSKFFDFVIQAEKIRIGNCTELAMVGASYLWRFPGKEIKRIEVVKAIDFDHVWLILNRKKDSDLLNSSEWDEDCWVFDPWWKEEGVFYHATHFQEKIIEVLSYLITQYEWLKKDKAGHVPLQKTKKVLNQYKKDLKNGCLKVPIKLKNQTSIDIDTMPYPFDSNMRMSDYYEEVSLNKKQVHQQKFKPCLDEIKKFKK